MIDVGFGITTGDRELRGASSETSDLRRIQTLALKEQRSTVALETADLNRRAARNDLVVSIQTWAGASGESVRSAKIGR